MIQRTEKKYPFVGKTFWETQLFLASYGFNKSYPSRLITSLYFDTPSLSLFTDSEEGLTPRYKTRLRWYGQSLPRLETANFEIKRTLFNSREKESVPIVGLPQKRFREWDQIITRKLRPILFVRYFRTYFSDVYGNRATVDVDIRYCLSQPRFEKETVRPVFVAKDAESVMELKLSNLKSGIELLDNVPLNATRFSKYCRGVCIMIGRTH